MRLPSDFKRGDKVLVIERDELEQFLRFYSNGDDIDEEDLNEIAGTIVTVLWVPDRADIDAWDGWIPVKTSQQKVVNLPFAALIEIPVTGIVEEPDDDDELHIVRDKESEGNLVMQLAAETIQSTYRRYRACKPAVKLRRVTSEEKLVMALAADTIKQGFRSKRKNRGGRPPRAPSTMEQVTISSSSCSTPRRTLRGDHKGSLDSYMSSSQSVDTSECEVDTLYAQILHSPPGSPPRPDFYPAMSPLCLHVSEIHATGMKSVKWSGKNDPYVVLSIGGWRYETEVVWEANEDVSWKNVNAVGLFRQSWGSHDRGDSDVLSLEVYNANLVRDDQLVGAATFPLGDIVINSQETISVDIHDTGRKHLFRGHLEVSVVMKETAIEEVTSGLNEHNMKKSASRKEVAAGIKYDGSMVTSGEPLQDSSFMAEPKYNDSYQVEEKSSVSAVQSVRSSETKRSIESEIFDRGGQEIKSESKSRDLQSIPAGISHASRNAPGLNTSKVDSSIGTEVESKALGRSHESSSEVKRGGRTSNRPKPSLFDSSIQKTNSSAHKEGKHKLSRSKSAGVSGSSGTCTSKKKVSKTVKPRKNKDRAVLDECSGFDFKEIDIFPDTQKRVVDEAFEIALLEENASISLHKHEAALVLDALGVVLNAHAHDLPTASSERVLLSLQNPALLAAVLTEYARDNNLVNYAAMKISPKQFSLSEIQSVTAIKQLVGLVHGTWKKIRKVILDAAATNLSCGGSRPAFWISDWVSKLTEALQFPVERFESLTGEDFMFLDDDSISMRLKPSILRARCRVYRQVLRHLDEWWDRGMRPKDVLSKSFSPDKVDSMVIQTPPKMSTGKENSKSCSLREGDYVKLASSEKLLRAYMPIHRAYAWSASFEDMTAICDIIGNAVCAVTMRPPAGAKKKDLTGMQWVNFRDDAPCPKNKSHKVLDMLREYDDDVEAICGRCVYVPSMCVKRCPPPQEDTSTPLSLADIPIEEIVNDMEVRVQSIDLLCRAYERFDWWDRPSSSVFLSIAGKRGRVVSCASAEETRRIGVSVTGPNGADIVDAIPLEALLYIPKPGSPIRPSISNKRKTMDVPKEKTLKVKRSEPSKVKVTESGTKIINANVVERGSNGSTLKSSRPHSASARHTSGSNKTSATKLKGESNNGVSMSNGDIPRRSYKAWTRSSTKDSVDTEESPQQVANPTPVTEKADNNSGGGDDSAIPEWDEEEFHNEIVSDPRLRSKSGIGSTRPSSSSASVRPARPLYRPITAEDLAPSPTPRDIEAMGGFFAPTETTDDNPLNYTWMRRSLQPDVYTDAKVIEEVVKPRTHSNRDSQNQSKVTATNIDFNLSHETPVGRSQNEKNLVGMSVHMKRSNARGEGFRESKSKQKPRTQDNIDVIDDNNSFGTDGTVEFGVSGVGLSTGKTATWKSSRPKSASATRRGPSSKTSSVRPKSANTSRKNETSRSNRPWMQQENVANPEDPKYNERLWRELKRTEKETRAKEAALRRQLKKMGMDDDVYDSYHNV
mmetsp:Transcript_22366/g.32582  ORF Transcript_22366/g.32582 Transcript_22366/m.32582 type:complete len:1512 (-) Transcript_22366:227-4762(-)|eukprot:CAMPEP_0185034518 /NCGR_PEP_ID=MMETSP1103-20130426/24488_1 /TAXON_ID=36769 /ORGANISM="Paraphysomonas bandaiensis, Strain Caron Lab Isolate" /LENGTH=1511 /DNA_ID=CAMNT_0027571209 /DNA_START=46 /DNA_END=4581 /DNA_ORIENTATION=-